jgi:hypothetical protein
MMIRSSGLIALTVAVVALFVAAWGAAVAQEEPTTHVYPVGVAWGDGEVSVDVMVEDAANLAGFQFILSWDPERLTLSDIEHPGFLGETGRDPFCFEPVIDPAAVRFVCVTFAPPPADADPQTWSPPPGVAGTGALARAHFEVRGQGSSMFALSIVKLTEPDGSEIPSTSEGRQIDLADSGGIAAWLVVGGGAAALVVVGGGAGAWILRRRGRAGDDEGEAAAVAVRRDERHW